MTRVVGFVCGFPTSMSQAWAELVRAGSVCSCSSGLQRLAVATRRAVRCGADTHAACSSSGQRSPCTLRARCGAVPCRAVPCRVYRGRRCFGGGGSQGHPVLRQGCRTVERWRGVADGSSSHSSTSRGSGSTSDNTKCTWRAACSVQPPNSHGGALTKINNGGAHTSTEPGVGWGRRKHRHRCSFSRDSEP